MQNLNNLDNKILTSSKTSKKKCDSDNAWNLSSLSEKEIEKWEVEKARYYEICEYLEEINDILDLIKPFPRDKDTSENVDSQNPNMVKSGLKNQSRESGKNHLENIIKLVEKLKELQDKGYKQKERYCFGKDLKKLREDKKKLKSEKLKQLINEESKKQFISDLPTELEQEFSESINPKNKNNTEDLIEQKNQKEKEKFESLLNDLGEGKLKISKWTKVKEAFHWEKAIHPSVSKSNKKFKNLQERNDGDFKRENFEDHLPVQVWVFSDDNCPPSPPTPPPLIPRLRPLTSSKNEDFLLAPPLQDFPSSSSSDRLDEFVFTDSSKKGSKSPDANSTNQFFNTDDIEDCGCRTRKSSSEEFITQISHKPNKDDFNSLSKSNRTTWGKVKDIIHTRRESLKKKPKKKSSNDFSQRRKLSSPPAIHFTDQIEDLSTPEDKPLHHEESIDSKTNETSSAEILTSFENEKRTRKSMPLLTITLPSSEETKILSSDVSEKRFIKEDEKPNVVAQYCEEKPKFTKNKTVQNQKLSRWVKVKRVFLTSSSPPRTPLFELGTEPSPTGQHKFGFFSDVESDEVSSGEWNDETVYEKTRMIDNQISSSLQDDIKKSYQELQKKLSQEFEQKIKEWDIKNETIAKADNLFHKTLAEDKLPTPKFKKSKDFAAAPLPNLNDLSPEFRKKLNDWKKIKSTQGSVCSSNVKEDVQGSNAKIKIGEWQPWKSRCSLKHSGKCEQNFFDEFKKSEIQKHNLNSVFDEQKQEVNNAWRDLKEKEHFKNINNGRTSSAGDTMVGWNLNEAKLAKKIAKMKDFQWVQKELQKIEREKMRLEQEREKFLQREARLEQMKRTMGPAFPAQEILVKTPTGLIRFKGISQKFTKKLYEWEKARGIAPEASTFALLEERAITSPNNISDGEMILQRSKSMGSIADLPNSLLVPGVAHYPSSLSLNDVDELKTLEEEDILDDSLSCDHFRIESSKQPEALLVEVEDVVEEAEMETDFPKIKGEVPKYTFASQELNQLESPQKGLYLPIYNDVKEPKCTDNEKRIIKTVDKNINCTRENMSKVVEWMEQMNKSSEITTADIQLNSNGNKNRSVLEAKVQNQFLKNKEIQKSQSNESVILQTTPILFPVLENKTNCRKLTDNFRNTEMVSTNKATNLGAIEKKKIQTSELEHIEKNKSNDSEAMKQKIKEKITLMQRMSTDSKFKNKWKYDKCKESMDEKAESTKNKVTENCNNANTSKFLLNEQKSIDKYLTYTNSVNVFVPTVRKIYSPIKSSLACSYVVDDIQMSDASHLNEYSTHENEKPVFEKNFCKNNFNQVFNKESEKLISPFIKENLLNSAAGENKKFVTKSESTSKIIGMPPLPNSPKSHKKLTTKETAPSIKMIIDKYNQKISEKESTNEGKSDGGSVIGWRSPVLGRRAKEKAEKYLKSNDELPTKNNQTEIQKSVSFDTVKAIPISCSPENLLKENLPNDKKIFKSNSVGIIELPSQTPDYHSVDVEKLNKPEANLEDSFSTLRAFKIKKAKEDFLSGRNSVSSDASSTHSANVKYFSDIENTKLNKTNKLSNTETICDTLKNKNLIKSVSVETITSEKNPSQSDDQSFCKKNLQKSSPKFDLSSIRSKFRRMRWRKEKNTKLNSVATLCRQSLLIEVPSTSKANLSDLILSKSCPSSPVMSNKVTENSEKKT